MAAGFDLKAVRAGVKSILQDISGISVARDKQDRAIDDETQPWSFADSVTGASMSFKVIGLRSLGGGDEVRTEYDPDAVIEGDTSGPEGAPATGGFIVGVGGPRVLTMSVKCEVYGDQEHTAFEYVERARSNLNLPSILQRIADLECSLNSVGNSRDMTSTKEGRTVSVCQFDLVLNITSNLTEEDPVTTIKTVNVAREEP